MDAACPSDSRQRNLRLIDLACQCVFITSEEKDHVLNLFKQQEKDDEPLQVTDIFRQEDLVSEKRIEYLMRLDEFYQVKRRDRTFGRIAVANQFVLEEDVKHALEYQDRFFEKSGFVSKIGDILVDTNRMSKGNQIAILLTQNRFKNEDLMDALARLGTMEPEQKAINKRFGAIGIKHQMISIDDVNQALEKQEAEKSKESGVRFIGEVLKESGKLTDEEILTICTEQRQAEKRRLDLEKALYSLKAEMKISKKLNRYFDYRISRNGLDLKISKRKETIDDIGSYEMLIWLKRIGVKYGITPDETLNDIILRGEIGNWVTVARGTPAGKTEDEQIEFYFTDPSVEAYRDHAGFFKTEPSINKQDKNKEAADRENNPFSEGSRMMVEKGTLLARIIPGFQGKPGRDVLGYPVRADDPQIAVLHSGPGVVKEDLLFVADKDGYPIIKKGAVLSIESEKTASEIIILDTSIHHDTEEEYTTADLEISGDIEPDGLVRCASLKLTGNLMGTVICSGPVDIRGDIGAAEKIPEPETPFFPTLICRGDLRIQGSICHAVILTEGDIKAHRSTVIASQLTAAGNIWVNDLLTFGQASSIIRFGVTPDDELAVLEKEIADKENSLITLKRESEILQLTDEYGQELATATAHELKQHVLNNLVEIIDAPELYQYQTIREKADYLFSLPDYSSIKDYYLKIPQSEAVLSYLDQLTEEANQMNLEQMLVLIQSKIDKTDADESLRQSADEIEMQLKTRISAIEREVKTDENQIRSLQTQIQTLHEKKSRILSEYLESFVETGMSVFVKNQCEKGTVIKGRVSEYVAAGSIYQVEFKEEVARNTNGPAIVIHNL